MILDNNVLIKHPENFNGWWQLRPGVKKLRQRLTKAKKGKRPGFFERLGSVDGNKKVFRVKKTNAAGASKSLRESRPDHDAGTV